MPPLTGAILQLLQLGIEVAPQIAQWAETEINLFINGNAPTAAEDAQIQAALAAANSALQAA